MAPNIGRTDRLIRLILGFLILGLGGLLHSPVGIIGLLPIVTAVIGWCPSYLPFGINTCREEDRT